MPPKNELILEVEGREVKITSPDKLYFPQIGKTKLDLVKYFLSVGEGALRGVKNRPMVLKRFVDGAEGKPFFQKRTPTPPPWLRTCTISFPSGRTADELVVDEVAGLAWTANLGCLDLNPWPVRTEDVDRPDELRIDLDPMPDVPFSQVRDVAMVAREVLEHFGLTGYPKTSGNRGLHILVRIQPRWDFQQVRKSALAVAREIELRAPALATSKWWREERHGVFVDYNQNARDRTVASAYSVRPTPDARVSTPLWWDEVPTVDPAAFTLVTVPARFAERDDPHAAIDAEHGSLEKVLSHAEGQQDAPWPPHFPKQEGEAPRVQPSRRRSSAKKE